ncbi:hypothetical protein AAFF_G00006430 [Aldrovandia affinis]|uniref:Uncharacterized protein n=1 Tax=Aldrovandia affinis TaxID=143900 RepID=A0AAD7X5M1_9TELE|nr:hypothetical protein AAFF_G00006430 [Aldrovandia affinis]
MLSGERLWDSARVSAHFFANIKRARWFPAKAAQWTAAPMTQRRQVGVCGRLRDRNTSFYLLRLEFHQGQSVPQWREGTGGRAKAGFRGSMLQSRYPPISSFDPLCRGSAPAGSADRKREVTRPFSGPLLSVALQTVAPARGTSIPARLLWLEDALGLVIPPTLPI